MQPLHIVVRRLTSVLLFVVAMSLVGTTPQVVGTARGLPSPRLLQAVEEGPRFLTKPRVGTPLEIARDYLGRHHTRLGLAEADVADWVVTDQYVSRHNGVTHLHFRQRLNGFEVINATLNVNVAHDGSIINVGNRFVPNLHAALRPAPLLLSVTDAVEAVARHLRQPMREPPTRLRRWDGVEQRTLVSGGALSQEPIPARLVYQATESGVRLAWELVIQPPDGQHWWHLRVDGETGAVLAQDDWVVQDEWGSAPRAGEVAPARAANAPAPARFAPDSYRVLAMPFISPEEPGATHALVTDPAHLTASPFGWHDADGVAGAEFTDTRGNNVFAQEDTDANNTGGYRPSGGSSLLFDYPLDPIQGPTGGTNQAAAIVNLFYWNNISHDVFYHYGFDEASGNFQENSYGRGGLGGDPVQADAQDSQGTNNATFATPPDGLAPRMQMYLFTLTSPPRDSDLENTIILHEYGHGISNRLTGGPSNASCLQNAEQMGEGWSDWFALALTAKATDTAAQGRGLGTYVVGQPWDGPGVRPKPYSTDWAVNNYTYGNLTPGNVGYVWATMLWDMYWNLVDEYGFDPDFYTGNAGNTLAIQLVMDGLKLQPCSPGFVDGRDAILLADMVNNEGANQCAIWDAFARRGLGYSAQQGSSHSILDGVPAFDIPLACGPLTVTPTSQAICQGETATYDVLVSAAFTPPVDMQVSGQPAGTTATFSLDPVPTVPATTTLTISNTAGVTPTSYSLLLSASATSISDTVAVELEVAAVPGIIALHMPVNGATEVPHHPYFAWIPDSQATSYTLEVDDNADFSSIDYSATVAESSHLATMPLASLTPYYWRVRAANPCGVSSPSSPFSFTVEAVTGTLAGTLRAAESGQGLPAANVTVINDGFQQTVQTQADGSYALELPVGTYTVRAAALNRLPESMANVSVGPNTTTTVKFELAGSTLLYSPLSLSESLTLGQVVTHTVVVTNSGPLTLTLGTLISPTKGLGGPVSWASVSPASLMVLPYRSATFMVRLDGSAVGQPGQYQGQLTFQGNMVATPPPLSLTLNVVAHRLYLPTIFQRR